MADDHDTELSKVLSTRAVSAAHFKCRPSAERLLAKERSNRVWRPRANRLRSVSVIFTAKFINLTSPEHGHPRRRFRVRQYLKLLITDWHVPAVVTVTLFSPTPMESENLQGRRPTWRREIDPVDLAHRSSIKWGMDRLCIVAPHAQQCDGSQRRTTSVLAKPR